MNWLIKMKKESHLKNTFKTSLSYIQISVLQITLRSKLLLAMILASLVMSFCSVKENKEEKRTKEPAVVLIVLNTFRMIILCSDIALFNMTDNLMTLNISIDYFMSFQNTEYTKHSTNMWRYCLLTYNNFKFLFH